MHFVFFGAVSVDDSNYPELKSLEEPLTKSGIIDRVQTFDGRHEWPPGLGGDGSSEWMELHAIKAGKRPRDDGFINAMWQPAPWLRKNTLKVPSTPTYWTLSLYP